MKAKIAVIGAGAWGTAIANLLSQSNETCLWAREEGYNAGRLIDIIKKEKENKKFLPGIILNEALNATSSLEEAIADSSIIISAIPSEYLKETAKEIKPLIGSREVISLTKGIEFENGKFRRMSEVLQHVLQVKKEKISVLSGPTLAFEIAMGYPAAAVLASESENAENLRELFNTSVLRVYRNEDIIGVEIGGALKNPYAIGAGICDYLIEEKLLGENSKAAYITRCLNEMKKIGISLGAKEKTFDGLSGMGDLILTCNSKQSRNHQVGYSLASGKSLKEIEGELHGKIAEGIRTAKNIYEYAETKCYDLNIIKQIYLVMYNQKNIKEAIKELMVRDTERE